jgi:hypothetical protein
MFRLSSAAAKRAGFGEMPIRRLRLVTPLDRALRGPDKYRILDLRRRRAQIRARRESGLG